MTAAPTPQTVRRDYHDALRVIGNYVYDLRERTDLLRRLRLATLARAGACGDRALCDEVMAGLQGVMQHEEADVAAAVRQAMCVQDGVGTQAWAERRWEWRGRLARMLTPGLTPATLDRVVFLAGRDERAWHAVALAAAAACPPDRTLVVYGLGRNGVQVDAALADGGTGALAADDRPEAQGRLARIDAGALGERHVVLVTPDDRDELLYSLRRRAVRDVLLPEKLWLAQAPATVGAGA